MAVKSSAVSRVRRRVPARRRCTSASRCFGPLEVAYDHSRAERRRRRAAPPHPGRPAEHLALRRLPAAGDGAARARARAPRRASGLPAGCTPLIRADRLAERLGLSEVWVKNDAANPTHSFKDRVVSVAVARARELGFDTLACASTGNLANAVAAAGRGARARRPTSSSRPTSRSRRSSRRASTGPTSSRSGATTTTSTACAPSCRGEQETWAFVNVNLRPYYAEGSKTLAYEIAEQLGWQTPDRVVAPIASGSLFTKIAKGFDEWRELGLIERRRCRRSTAPRPSGCSPVAHRLRRRARRLPAGQAGHDRQVAGDRQPGRRPVRDRARPPQRRRRSTRSPTTRSAPASACWPRRPASSPRPPAA